jgi:uncharacterized protein
MARPAITPKAMQHGTIGIVWVLLCLLVVLLSQTASAQPKFPPLTGRIIDEVGLLSADSRRALLQELEALEKTSTDQLVVYVTRSLQGYAIEDFGYQVGRTWQIGQKDKNNGVILIIAPNERKVRIEVGRGLEPQLTDIMSKLIIENAILPALRRNDITAAIKAGVRDIKDVLLGDAAAVKERARAAASRSGGGNNMAVTILIAIIVLAFALVIFQSGQTARPSNALRDPRRTGRRREDVGFPISWGSSSGGWSGGGSGGGFSGGGGDFGGGGASGSW